jgi:dTDP-4-amino-4,6-dideoxygalactose transaminase
MCGEGGALVIKDPRYVRRAEILRQKGTNRERFYRGEINKYTWVDCGSSYVPSELQSAFLMAQLEKLAPIAKKRRLLYERYHAALAPLATRGVLHRPVIPAECESSYHLFHLLFVTERDRDRVLAGLQRKGIYATFHFIPLHLSAMGRRFGYRRGDLPVSENVSGRLLRLPLYNSMAASEQDRVIRALKALF